MAHVAITLLIVGIVVLYVVLCPRLNYAFYRPLLFHPAKFQGTGDSRAPELSGVQGENISFSNSSSHNLTGWYFQKPSSEYTILLSHGNGGNVSFRLDTVTMLLDAGASVLIYDYRGYGLSQGLPTVAGVCDDAVSAYDFLNRTRGVAGDQIILYGESLGCAVSTYLSTQRKCAGIILQSGFASLNKIAREIFPLLAIYPGPLLAHPPLNSVDVLKKPHPPVLIAHGHKDQVVPFAHAQLVYESACEPKTLLQLPDVDHCDICTLALDEYRQAVSDFLKVLGNHQSAAQSTSVPAV